MTSTSHNVFIVDDHEAIRFAYREFLRFEPEISVVGEAETGREALSEIPAHQPDVALIDLSLGKMNGLEVTRRLRAMLPDLKILIVSNNDQMVWTKRALSAGANGYLPKELFETTITEAVRTVTNGERFLPEPALH